MPTFTTFIQHSFVSPSHGNQRRKKKGIQIGKEEVKLLLFADDITLYIKNPKDGTRKLLKLIDAFGKFARDIEIFVFLSFLGLHLQQKEVPRLGVKSEL